MPTVRRAEQQVGLRALPSGTKQAAATPASEGAYLERARADKWNAVGTFGDRVTHIAQQVGQIQAEARAHADDTAVMRASNQINDWKTERFFNPETGVFAQKGEAVLPLPEMVKSEYADLTGKIAAGLSTPRQRENFAKVQGEQWDRINLDVQRHVFGEMQQFQAGELKSHISNQINDAIQHASDPKMVAASLHSAISAIDANAARTGMGTEEKEASKLAVRTKVHTGVISSLLANDQTQEAEAYYAAAKSEIAGDQQDQVAKQIEAGTLRGQAQKTTDEILRAGGTLTEQRDKARAIDDPKLRDEVQARLEHESAVRDRADREQEQASMQHGYDILDQTHDVNKIPPAVWANYSGATRSAMRGYALSLAKGVPTETDPSVYYTLMKQAGDSPDSFVTSNLLQYRGKLDDGDFKQLVGLQLSLKNSDRKAADKILAPFNIDDQQLNDSLALYGIDPKAKPDSPQGQAIGQVRILLRKQADLLQSTTGKKATNEDVQSVIDGVLSQKITVPGFFGPKTKPLVAATAADIPKGFRARNPGVSDPVLLQRWIEAQNRLNRGGG